VRYVTEEHPVVEALRRLDIDKIAPIEALNKLYELKKAAMGKN